VRRVENTAWKFIETDTNNNTWDLVICICFHDFPSGVFNSSHNGVLLFVSVSITFQAVFSTLHGSTIVIICVENVWSNDMKNIRKR
jgi:hypothetical protein